jgi:hypothetical protein
VTETPQPTSGSLSAKIIRACEAHANKCPLTCRYRTVEDLGEIATFGSESRSQHEQSILDRLKEAYYQWHHSSPRSEKP